MFRKTLTALAMLACSTVIANAAGDPVKGAQVFKRCAICHTATRGGANGVGPNLFGIVGTKAGAVPGYSFSAALKKSGVVWTEANLIKWVSGPARMIPGNKMPFAGLTSKKQQADVVAYLETLK
jgi:cytochrome c2